MTTSKTRNATKALYSKNATVSHAGETALLYLTQVDPRRIAPPLIDFSLRALDISSVNLSHQAPSALSVLSRLLQPALRAQSSIVLSRLPDMLRLTLAGIDSNDQNKSLRTLIFYRNLVMWLPVGGSITVPSGGSDDKSSVLDCDGNDGTKQIASQLMDTRYSISESESYKAAIASLPESSFLAQLQGGVASYMMDNEDGSETEVLMQDAMAAMSDWSLTFLDRIYELLRAAGEQEKLGNHGGVGTRHTAADVAMAKNFSRIMKETLTYFFAAMDEQTYKAALRSVVKFIQEETLPFAVKDASMLCQAVCSTRFSSGGSNASPGLDALLPILIEDLQHMSNKAVIYRLRCLSGAVRFAGVAVLKHTKAITETISFALSKSNDRVILKTGCKLLRHVLSSQLEEYTIAQSFHPMRLLNDGDSPPSILGASALLHGDKICWHVPTGKQIDFAVSILSDFTLPRWKGLGNPTSDGATTVDLKQWRNSLRVLRYTLRGSSGILLDEDPEVILSRVTEFCPKEMAVANLILSSSAETRKTLQGLRKRLCFNLMDIMSLIAKNTADCESKTNGEDGKKIEMGGSISSDTKICKEVIQIAELLMTRRGAQYRGWEGKSVWRGQKEILTDYASASASDYICSVLSRCNDQSSSGISHPYYKDGENSGKNLSRALVVNRVHLSNQALTESASSLVPRRLKKLRDGSCDEASVSLFSLGMTWQSLQKHLSSESEPSYDAPRETSLEAYEALFDGLCALSCHPNINVRGLALGTADFSLTPFGWLAKDRIPRMLAAINLSDADQKGENGIPSSSQLINQVNSQGKRTRLAEVVKGCMKIVAFPKIMKQFLWDASHRFELVKTLCGTQKLLKLAPPEEVPKIVHYVNSIFLAYRNRHFTLPRSSEKEKTLSFLLDILQDSNKVTTVSEKNVEDDDAGAIHWRDRLVAAWFILQFIDEQDLVIGDAKIVSRVWCACSKLIEEEVGQPLQRVSLGLLGRLVSLALVDMSQMNDQSGNPVLNAPDLSILCAKFAEEKFCRAFGTALVFDHREDSSVGGGHGAQWSSGIEEIIRDSTSNLANRTLFPFK